MFLILTINTKSSIHEHLISSPKHPGLFNYSLPTRKTLTCFKKVVNKQGKIEKWELKLTWWTNKVQALQNLTAKRKLYTNSMTETSKILFSLCPFPFAEKFWMNLQQFTAKSFYRLYTLYTLKKLTYRKTFESCD